MERIPTQRTTARVTALKPPKQTSAMKRILASLTLLIRQLSIGPNNTVANRTLSLPLHRSRHILPPRHQSINYSIPLPSTARREIDNALRIYKPEIPLLLCDTDAVHGCHFGASEGVWFGQVDGYGHGLFVDGDGG